ncbi:MAG: hypothetical protein EXS24_06130 [Pedosphaera sp.]|nr:hypothetical protein [Pedosphaera sp.]
MSETENSPIQTDAGCGAQKAIDEIRQLQSETRIWRIGAVVAIAAILAVCAYKITTSITGLVKGPGQKVFMSEIETGFKTRLLPEAERIGRRAVSKIVPKLQTEVNKLNDRVPELMEAASKEFLTLTDTLPEAMEAIISERFGEILHQREEKFRTLFPDATPEKVKKFFDELVIVTADSADSILFKLFAEHIIEINEINEKLQVIYNSEHKKQSTDLSPPNWKIALALFEMVGAEIREWDAVTKPDPETPKPPKRTNAPSAIKGNPKKTPGTNPQPK